MLQKRKWKHILLFVIIAAGIFLRTYHFSDWLLFEIDQTYDTRIVSQGIENGPQNLPLLGPTAGGGRALRLGPVFYYMEYLIALIFGNTPVGHAMLVLILSILAIPLFYIFAKRYFDTSVSLALTALFSVSAYLVLYGRFSWSPNVLPFLTLLSFYALLRSVSETETKRDRWFLIAVTAIAITSQIHFNAFFTIPTITVLFLLYKRPHFKLKTWLIALGIIALIYSPMILSDISTHGENAGFFLKKVSKGGSSSMLSGVFRKSVVDLQYTASGYFLIDSGIDHISGGRIKEYGFQDNADLPWRLLAIILLIVESGLLLWNIFEEKVRDKKDFLILVFLWTAIPFAYFYSLISSSFQIYPRFSLLIAPIAIILFGLLLEKIQPKKNAPRCSILVLITIMMLAPNIKKVSAHFALLADPKKSTITVGIEDVFPSNRRLTLKEQLEITNYVLEKQKQNGYPVYLSTIHEYNPVFWYHLSKQGVSYLGGINNNHLYAEGNYFLINYHNKGVQRIQSAFSISEKKNFGILTVYTLIPKRERVRAERQSPESKEVLEQTTQIQELKTWKDLL